MSCRTGYCRKISRIFALLAMAVVLLGVPQVALASGVDDPSDVFQLEGNATDDLSACFPLVSPCGSPNVTFAAKTDDWENINNNTSHVLGSATTGIVGDLINSQSDTIFTGGGSKDDLDVSSWLWKTAKVGQPKDDIEHVFAAAYSLANGHTAIYFGMDRWDNSGDATAGFWFLQDGTISLNGGRGGGGTHFTGQHMEGDLLIVSDFPNGGAVSEIVIYKWHNGGLVQDADLTSGASCNPASPGADACAIVNSIDGVTSPWGYTNKSNQTTFAHGELLEGAVDLDVIFGSGNIPCFSTFLGETRASTTPSATLSDISGPHSFPLCKLTVSKSCTGSSIVNGNQITYNFSGSVTNSGVGTVYNVTLSDTPPSSSYVSGSLKINNVTRTPGTAFQLAASLGPTGVTNYTGSFTTNAKLGSGDKNTVTAKAASDPSGTPQNVGPETADWGDPTTGSCPPPITPGLTLAKKCNSCLKASGGNLVVSTTEAVNVCNTGNVNLTNVTVRDCRGTLDNQGNCSTGFIDPTGWSGVSLAAASGGTPTCTVLTTTASPSSLSACSSGNCSFSDVVVGSGTAAISGATANATPSSASCPLCPINTTCTAPTFP